jgi:hypothetical protein
MIKNKIWVVLHKLQETKHKSCETVSEELYKIHSKDTGMLCGWTVTKIQMANTVS